ncbi:N-acetylglucosamine-6-phosphate deacetylase [Gordoniibacillus kamchatkensis]|uniref:N-acetylglucosamine-6-phosphate deacetylase n=1 Tax=Gordoniibacillus kamchatkensis TaxID=1590651 RepID=A0ABR5AN99_9BACL|nr:N-acetylglucosamine-6-phosphate deacetylase [Paenibacillus sp. VKM B-2647]KIL42288.1 N-acetylglucosamine-6-phosphate deacetylase [Paenibacillus sp. VKM B-2647]
MKSAAGKTSGGVRHAAVVTETGTLNDAVLLWRDGTIAYVGSEADVPAELKPLLDASADAGGDWLLPGFIDIHVHGGYGGDFMEATAEAYDAITSFHARNGTTGMLATTVTASREAIDRVLEAVESYRSSRAGGTGAELYGVHLEGPFISPKWPGAQNPNFIVDANKEWLEAWTARYPGLIRMVTLAPERPGALDVVSWLASHGIIAACGHTDATYADIQAAAAHGLSHAVHTFNAMRGLHHREPGTVGAVLTDPRLHAEVIADGLHVHPAGIKLLTQVKTQRNLILITDAISAAGLGDGDYSLGGLDVVVKDGAARLKEGGALAGSTLTMIGAFRYMVLEIGLSVPKASELGSGNPARRLGLYGETGSIAAGKRADLLQVGASNLELRQVWKRGAKLE